MRILLVDDHELMRRGLKQALAEEFPLAEFSEAGRSEEAMDLFGRGEWDLVLLDINLPGRSGLEVLEEMKRVRPRTPVLVLSVYPEEAFAVRSLQLGAAGYLTKASASDELVAAARKALGGGRYLTVSLAERLAAKLGGEIAPLAHETLSSRELQVLRMVASGKSLKEIASELSLSEKTIGTYRSRLSEKLHLSTNVELTRYALQHRLVD